MHVNSFLLLESYSGVYIFKTVSPLLPLSPASVRFKILEGTKPCRSFQHYTSNERKNLNLPSRLTAIHSHHLFVHFPYRKNEL